MKNITLTNNIDKQYYFQYVGIDNNGNNIWYNQELDKKIYKKGTWVCNLYSDTKLVQPSSTHIPLGRWVNLGCNDKCDMYWEVILGEREYIPLNFNYKIIDNSIKIKPFGGVEPYYYRIKNKFNYPGYEENGLFTNLSSGLYLLEIKDSLNNKMSKEVEIEHQNIINYTTSITVLEREEKQTDKKIISYDFKVEITPTPDCEIYYKVKLDNSIKYDADASTEYFIDLEYDGSEIEKENPNTEFNNNEIIDTFTYESDFIGYDEFNSGTVTQWLKLNTFNECPNFSEAFLETNLSVCDIYIVDKEKNETISKYSDNTITEKIKKKKCI